MDPSEDSFHVSADYYNSDADLYGGLSAYARPTFLAQAQALNSLESMLVFVLLRWRWMELGKLTCTWC